MKEDSKRKTGSGGKRPGAGRKTDKPKPHTMRLTDDEKKIIEQLRAKQQ